MALKHRSIWRGQQIRRHVFIAPAAFRDQAQTFISATLYPDSPEGHSDFNRSIGNPVTHYYTAADLTDDMVDAVEAARSGPDGWETNGCLFIHKDEGKADNETVKFVGFDVEL
jgi:hypothetical protein